MKYTTVLLLICLSLSLQGKGVACPTHISHLASIQNPENDQINYDQGPVQTLSFDETDITKFKEDPDFDYTEIEEIDNWWTAFKRWLNDIYSSFLRWLFGDSAAEGFWGGFLQLLPYILLLLLLLALIWLFLRIDSSRLAFESLKAPQIDIGEDQDIIENQDIQRLIDKALSDQNYRLAVRYYYLLTLQKLSGKELIDWQSQKTNHDYIFEIEDHGLRQQFRRVTDLYDYIWYGNFAVDASAFAKAQHAFNTINQTL